MITHARVRKLRASKGLALVLASAAIFIALVEPGLIWMTASDRKQFRNWQGGRHPGFSFWASILGF